MCPVCHAVPEFQSHHVSKVPATMTDINKVSNAQLYGPLYHKGSGSMHSNTSECSLNSCCQPLPRCATGIGRSISRVDQIDVLQRPLSMEDGGVVLMDLLWSDPTTNDGVEGVQPSPRGPGLVTFGPDRVKEFCKVPSEKQ